MNDDVKDLAVGTGLFFYAVIIVVIAAILAGMLWFAVLPYFKNTEREITQHSNEYVQSKVTELVDSYDHYMRLETEKLSYSDPALQASYASQQVAVLHRMCNAYQLIPADVDDVPDYIVTFMEENNCG